MNLTLASPALLLLLPLTLLPLLRRREPALPISSLTPCQGLADSWRVRLSRVQTPLLISGLLLLIVALAGPTLERSHPITLHRGINLMLAVDISASMLADDIKPSRIEVARSAAADFVRQRQHDRIGVILFSGVPYLLAPPTTDPTPVIDRLLATVPDRIGSGTAIGDALAAATARLPRQQTGQSAVVLLTDGRSNRGRVSPLTAARAAATLGVRVYTIGFGSPEGAFLPPLPGSPPQKVVLDEAPLRQIAELTGGQYFRATGASELEQVYRQIDRLEKVDLEVREQIEREPLQPLLLRLTVLLLVTELLLFRTLLRRLP